MWRLCPLYFAAVPGMMSDMAQDMSTWLQIFYVTNIYFSWKPVRLVSTELLVMTSGFSWDPVHCALTELFLMTSGMAENSFRAINGVDVRRRLVGVC